MEEKGVAEEEEDSWEKTEVRFAINKYEDIFSDFDPRPLPQRGFSDDFLSEAKRAALVKEENINFIFMVPKGQRDIKKEGKLKERLEKYFNKHYKIIKDKKDAMVKEGSILTIVGIIMMMVATYLLFKYKSDSLWASFVIILFEPAGWFIFWHGLDNVFFEPREIHPDLEFHKKMANAKIKFVSV